jgi:hypothetical protein
VKAVSFACALVIAGLTAAFGLAQTTESVSVARMVEPIQLDGKLDEAIWQFLLAEKDRLRSWSGDILHCPENGPLGKQSRITFLARHGNGRKRCGLGCSELGSDAARGSRETGKAVSSS